jgi:hypothetical protein
VLERQKHTLNRDSEAAEVVVVDQKSLAAVEEVVVEEQHQ